MKRSPELSVQALAGAEHSPNREAFPTWMAKELALNPQYLPPIFLGVDAGIDSRSELVIKESTDEAGNRRKIEIIRIGEEAVAFRTAGAGKTLKTCEDFGGLRIQSDGTVIIAVSDGVGSSLLPQSTAQMAVSEALSYQDVRIPTNDSEDKTTMEKLEDRFGTVQEKLHQAGQVEGIVSRIQKELEGAATETTEQRQAVREKYRQYFSNNKKVGIDFELGCTTLQLMVVDPESNFLEGIFCGDGAVGIIKKKLGDKNFLHYIPSLEGVAPPQIGTFNWGAGHDFNPIFADNQFSCRIDEGDIILTFTDGPLKRFFQDGSSISPLAFINKIHNSLNEGKSISDAIEEVVLEGGSDDDIMVLAYTYHKK